MEWRTGFGSSFRPILLLLAACAGISPARAGTIAVKGSVANFCALSGQAFSLAATSARGNGQSFTVTVTNPVFTPRCNVKTNLAISAKALVRTTLPTLAAGDSQTINYRATATGWVNSGLDPVVNTTDAFNGTGSTTYTGTAVSSNRAVNSVTITINNFSSAKNGSANTRPVDGNYSGSVTITLTVGA